MKIYISVYLYVYTIYPNKREETDGLVFVSVKPATNPFPERRSSEHPETDD